MPKTLNIIAVTLLVALVCTVLATMALRYIPAILNPGLQAIALAAWMSGIACWHFSRAATRHEADAARPSPIVFTVVVLFAAIGVGVALHFYGGRLLAMLPI